MYIYIYIYTALTEVMCIYAILGVEFFRTYGVGGFYLNEAAMPISFFLCPFVTPCVDRSAGHSVRTKNNEAAQRCIL